MSKIDDACTYAAAHPRATAADLTKRFGLTLDGAHWCLDYVAERAAPAYVPAPKTVKPPMGPSQRHVRRTPEYRRRMAQERADSYAASLPRSPEQAHWRASNER